MSDYTKNVPAPPGDWFGKRSSQPEIDIVVPHGHDHGNVPPAPSGWYTKREGTGHARRDSNDVDTEYLSNNVPAPPAGWYTKSTNKERGYEEEHKEDDHRHHRYHEERSVEDEEKKDPRRKLDYDDSDHAAHVASVPKPPADWYTKRDVPTHETSHEDVDVQYLTNIPSKPAGWQPPAHHEAKRDTTTTTTTSTSDDVDAEYLSNVVPNKPSNWSPPAAKRDFEDVDDEYVTSHVPSKPAGWSTPASKREYEDVDANYHANVPPMPNNWVAPVAGSAHSLTHDPKAAKRSPEEHRHAHGSDGATTKEWLPPNGSGWHGRAASDPFLNNAHTRGLAHVKRADWASWTTPESKRQGIATLHFVFAYQYVMVGIVGVLTIRNIVHYIKRRYRKFSLSLEKNGSLTTEKLMKAETENAIVTVWAVFDKWTYYPLTSKWWGGLENPLQVFIFWLAFSLNVAFILAVDTDFRGVQDVVWNKIHVVALRCGFMSMAQMPAIFALTGRNSLIQSLTGIEYQHLRFVHKLLACWCGLLGLIHTCNATMAHLVWYGGKGVHHLYNDYLGKTGIIMLVGFFCLSVFSIRRIRMNYYELFLTMHVTGATMMIVGIRYHVPLLKIWCYVPVAFWAYERLTRILQLVSIHLLIRLQFRPPLVQAHATLIEGAIVLRVPFKGKWSAGQHAYVSFWDSAFLRTPYIYGQTHPFSIANVPGSTEIVSDGTYEMVFVMRTREGMTNIVQQKLEASTNGAMPLWVMVEGPYGGSIDTEQFQEILLVAGGSGITHVSSMLGNIIHKARTTHSRVKKVKLVWTVQTVEQSIWECSELLIAIKKAADAGIEFQIELFVTRGMFGSTISRTDTIDSTKKERLGLEVHEVPERRRSSAAELDAMMAENPYSNALHITPGRPHLDMLIPAFVAGAHGKSLVAACGPGPMSNEVKYQVCRLMTTYPVQMEIALFEC